MNTNTNAKLSLKNRDEVNRLIEECQEDLEGVLFRLVWQREHLLEALSEIRAVATGEEQVANDDTEGMQWIVERIDYEGVTRTGNSQK